MTMPQNTFGFPPGARTVGMQFAGQVMALDFERAAPELTEAWPYDNAVAAQTPTMSGPVEVQRGERFAVARRVAVMPIRGILTPDSAVLERYFGWATYQGIEAASTELAANEDVSAIVLDMNSPGGLVLGLEGASRAIAALAAVKPVHVIVNQLAASAAYQLASQARDITMTPGSEVGSIGTMRMSVWPVEPDAWGDKWGIHLSSHARAKNPNPTSEEGLAEIQRSLDEAESAFLDAVAAGRKLDRATLSERLSMTDDPADGGAMFRVSEAIKRGLADSEAIRSVFYERVFATYAPKQQGTGARAMTRAAAVRMAKAISST